jgi:transcriptional regulator with XRE-family HTH domain
MVAEKIKFLREQNNMTQAELARKLGITRSSVNAWELGFSIPSTQYIVELANLFTVSTDYLLGVKTTSTIDVTGLTEKDVEVVYVLINHLKTKNGL